eukprot:Blabericola_migrator_1__8980@NODE_4779_length_982_cov_252_691803_g2979_i0_p2_GENE_NODE_4779_length_982_cov_252_691803_g2979_i0NODE_4779_length_982_cov_252_691803_g2979_i0_p2_ORF_typecomplete_len118_score17_29SelR/PF01641_18/4_6e24GFA/PF04828_14/1_6e02GFA/PF04828_14/0_44_NODE_4779_length_982_cov_252_691803_g2979_i0588941
MSDKVCSDTCGNTCGFRVSRTDEEWRKILSPEAYEILRKAQTERPFDNEYWNNKRVGRYHCRACDVLLFDSNAKFESGSGWPSFFKGSDDIVEQVGLVPFSITDPFKLLGRLTHPTA